jgi:hypothetical protein
MNSWSTSGFSTRLSPTNDSPQSYAVSFLDSFAQGLPNGIALPFGFAVLGETRKNQLELPDAIGNSLDAAHFVSRL